MSLELHMKAGRLIKAPRDQVWQAFCRLSGFEDWAESGGPQLALGLSGGEELIPVQAKLIEARPGEMVAIAGQYKKLKSILVFAFGDDPRGTRVQVSESLKGWAILWKRSRYSPKEMSRSHQAWLRELEQEVMTLAKPELRVIEAPG